MFGHSHVRNSRPQNLNYEHKLALFQTYKRSLTYEVLTVRFELQTVLVPTKLVQLGTGKANFTILKCLIQCLDDKSLIQLSV